MAISYNYEIVAVNHELGVMEIKYTADGYPTQLIGARLPRTNESLTGVVETYSPVAIWEEESAARRAVAVGANGTINPPTPQEPTYAELRAAEYPAIGDQLDALFHAGVFPAEMAAQIQAIKNKYPKV